MSLFDSAFATAKTLAKEIANGGITARVRRKAL
jgi:hypothetical protein